MPPLWCPPKIWVNRDAGNKGPAIRDYYRDAGNKGPAVSSLAALMICIAGLNTAQLKEFLSKLQIPAVEEVPGVTMSEAVKVSYPVICNAIWHTYIT